MLCRDVYHCLPDELDRQDYERILKHLVCMDVEARWREAQRDVRDD